MSESHYLALLTRGVPTDEDRIAARMLAAMANDECGEVVEDGCVCVLPPAHDGIHCPGYFTEFDGSCSCGHPTHAARGGASDG